jgi:hypothetical protein
MPAPFKALDRVFGLLLGRPGEDSGEAARLFQN